MRHQGGKDNRSVLHIDAAAPIQIQVWHVPPSVCLLVVPPTSLLEFNLRTIEMDWIDVTLQRYFESLQGQKSESSLKTLKLICFQSKANETYMALA